MHCHTEILRNSPADDIKIYHTLQMIIDTITHKSYVIRVVTYHPRGTTQYHGIQTINLKHNTTVLLELWTKKCSTVK
jgi:hypothetical protein